MNQLEDSIKNVEHLLRKGKLSKAVLSIEEIIAFPKVKTQLQRNAEYQDVKNSLITLSANVSEIRQDLQNGIIDPESLSIKKNSVLQKALFVLEKIAEQENLQIPLAQNFHIGINGVDKSKKAKRAKKRLNYILILSSSLITLSIITFLAIYKPFSHLEGKDIVIENGEENEKALLDNVHIVVNVLTLDNFKLTEEDRQSIKKINARLGLPSIAPTDFEFNTFDNFIADNLPVQDPTFKRIEGLLQDQNLESHFSIEDRRKLITSREYWNLKRVSYIPQVLVFPENDQFALAVLSIKGALENGKLTISKKSDDLHSAIDRIDEIGSYQLNKNSDGYLYACVFPDEKIIFNSENYQWEITIKEIVNPGKWRSESDIVILDWKAKNCLFGNCQIN